MKGALALVALLATGCAVGAQLERGPDERPDAPDPAEPPVLGLLPSCPASSPVVTQLALSDYSSYALLDDGSLWCWGHCWPRQMSDDVWMVDTTPRPVRIELDGVVRVAAGYRHACAALNDGTVRCWGRNLVGEAGPMAGTWTIEAPSHVTIDHVVDLNAGHRLTCALRKDGTVACWGLPQLFFPLDYPLPGGVLEAGPQETPVEIPGIEPDGVEIKGKHILQCVRRTTGQLRCFGRTPMPDLSSEVVPIRTFAASAEHLCLADVAGHARCYFGAPMLDPPSSVSVWEGSEEIAVSSGGGHACALNGGLVRCAQDNVFVLTSLPEDMPAVPGLLNTKQLDIGWWHGCAVDAGCVRCWGRNDEGQLGNGTYESSSTPTFVVWK